MRVSGKKNNSQLLLEKSLCVTKGIVVLVLVTKSIGPSRHTHKEGSPISDTVTHTHTVPVKIQKKYIKTITK